MTTAEFNQCVDEHSDNVYRFILKNIKDEDEAKDIVQDAFEKLWIKSGEIAFEKSKSYLFTAAYHTMIDRIRKKSRSTHFQENHENTFYHNKQYTDLKKIVNEAVSRLPEVQRSVVLLRDYEGYSYEEIAEITKLSASQVKVYIYRARVFLKQYIGKLENVI
jgi:RNA polymerase sigma factor (sigma-70 family)